MNNEEKQPLSDADFTKEFHRFQTKDKARAFSLMQELEEKEDIKFAGVVEKDGKRYRRYIKTSWRTSENFSDRIAFDIDNHDEMNLKLIYLFYSRLFQKDFNVIRTKHGYHLIGKEKYNSHDEWRYNACRVLCPDLEKVHFQKYIYDIDAFYDSRKKERDQKELTRKELQELTKDFEHKFRISSLYSGVGEFEVLFAINAIKRGFYSLRISKKDKKDNPIMLKIE